MAGSGEFVVGLDLGGTFLKYALGTLKGEIYHKGKKPSKGEESKEAIFGVIFEAIDECIAIAKENGGSVVAMGLGSPGAVHFDLGKLMGNTPNLPDWGDADVKGTIEQKYNIPIWADNDANVMTLAESRQGAAKGCEQVIAITLGTGIGGGIMVNNQIYRGTNYAGAELGHVSIDYNGRPCNCGGTGCVEQYASAPSMVRNFVEKLTKNSTPVPENVTTKTIFEMAAKGDKDALDTIDETCVTLGSALASIVNIFNPQMIVIGGGVADAGEEFMKQIFNVVKKRAISPALKGLKLVKAQLGNDAGMIGAMSLAAEMYEMKK